MSTRGYTSLVFCLTNLEPRSMQKNSLPSLDLQCITIWWFPFRHDGVPLEIIHGIGIFPTKTIHDLGYPHGELETPISLPKKKIALQKHWAASAKTFSDVTVAISTEDIPSRTFQDHFSSPNHFPSSLDWFCWETNHWKAPCISCWKTIWQNSGISGCFRSRCSQQNHSISGWTDLLYRVLRGHPQPRWGAEIHNGRLWSDKKVITRG